jgi:NhaP-type Na+/H+ or K+/H+ antiporter
MRSETAVAGEETEASPAPGSALARFEEATRRIKERPEPWTWRHTFGLLWLGVRCAAALYVLALIYRFLIKL